jgi:hypothetical protein
MSSPESWMKSSPMHMALLRHTREIGGRVLHPGDVLQLEQSRFMVSTDMSTTERGGML